MMAGFLKETAHMAAMLADRNNKIFLLEELTTIFMKTMWANIAFRILTRNS